jgi:Uroporphyrinogen decarboxylase (URO-D).
MKFTKLFLSVAVLAATLFVSCAPKQASDPIPSDKKEIMDRFVAGTLDPSYVPALFFGHFGGDQKLGEGAVKAHLSLFLKGGADMLKIQTEQPMPHVEDLTMDTPLVPEDWYAPTVEVIKEVLSYVGKDVYVMPTILSTHQVARQGFGDDRLPVWAVERPEAYKRMLDSYTKAILWYIRECKKIGVEAFFTATQGGEQKFYELNVPGGFFETMIKPYDLEVMNEANKDTKITILHICDWEGPMDDLTRYLDYPGKIVNVPLKIADEPLTLTKTVEMFGRPVLGGFNRKAEIGKESPEKIAAMTREIIANGPKGRLMIGADCSVPSPLNITDNIHAAVSTAHGR